MPWRSPHRSGDKISVETRLAAIAELLPALKSDAPDPSGFRKPFAALVLSELARADLMLQLALNPALDKAQLDRMIAAVATQVTPPGEQFYVYGESARLARPVLYAALRGLHTAWSPIPKSPTARMKNSSRCCQR